MPRCKLSFQIKALGMSLIFLITSLQLHANQDPSSNPNSSNSTRVLITDGKDESGKLHYETRSFIIESPQDVKNVQQFLTRNLDPNKPVDTFVHLADPSEPVTDLEKSLADSLPEAKESRIVPSLHAQKKVARTNLILTYVRLVLNTGSVTTGLVMAKGVPIEHALVVGLFAGGLSALVQYKIDAINAWLENSYLLVKAAQKMHLIPDSQMKELSIVEHVLVEKERFLKWALMEAVFLAVCRTAMIAFDIPITDSFLMAVFLATGSQGIYENGLLSLTRRLIKQRPHIENKIIQARNSAIFAGSLVSVISSVSFLIGIDLGKVGFALLTVSGIIAYAPVIKESGSRLKKTWEEYLERRKTTALSCQALFN